MNEVIANEKVDVFLEHFGIKGMHWGKRSNNSKGGWSVQKQLKINKYGDGTKPHTRAQKNARQQRNIRRVHTGVKLAAGALFVASLISMKGNEKAYTSTRLHGGGVSKSVKDIINSQRDVKINALKKTHREGHIDKEQLDNFINIINKRYDRKIVDAVVNK